MADWKTQSSDVVYETQWFKIYRDQVLNQNSKELTYSYLKLAHPAVVIVATDDQNRILLQRNYRYTIRETLWEIPAGGSDRQAPLEAAKRELLEEAGLVSDDWSPLGGSQGAVGVADIKYYYFLARNVVQSSKARDEDEDISGHKFVTLEEVRRMILHDEIVDDHTLIGIYRYMLESNFKER